MLKSKTNADKREHFLQLCSPLNEHFSKIKRMKKHAHTVLLRATRFLGHGDPRSAKLWFVGLEEPVPLQKISDLNELPTDIFRTRNGCAGTSTAVYAIISKLIMSLQGDTAPNDWRTYRDNRLFAAGSEVFLTNLYPLGKKIEKDWPRQYQKWLGMTREEYYRWIQRDAPQRFNFLKEQRQHYGQPLTICFGKRHWPHFARCFQLQDELFHDTTRFRCYPEAGMVMTEFFRSTRMPGESITALVKWINDQGLNPYRPSKTKRAVTKRSRSQ